LRFGPGANGFIIDSALLEDHHHAAQPASQPYQSFLLVASKCSSTVQRMTTVLNRYAAGTKRSFRRPADPLTADCRVARVAATPLALVPDYHRYLEPIKCEEVDPLPRLPHARAIARVGRQVILVFSLSRA